MIFPSYCKPPWLAKGHFPASQCLITGGYISNVIANPHDPIKCPVYPVDPINWHHSFPWKSPHCPMGSPWDVPHLVLANLPHFGQALRLHVPAANTCPQVTASFFRSAIVHVWLKACYISIQKHNTNNNNHHHHNGNNRNEKLLDMMF